ncbi:MAG: hypothetical protein M1824_000814 [Vezdaea acicularis]|nr:MAG: hypothetical protein M1824_000814 [Vezdaea acicularis]
MDSMRSLNTSLPTATASPRSQQVQPNSTSSNNNNTSSDPPSQILPGFKAAALALTNLYKTAQSEQVRSRQNGYQDALDDLLGFLDQENLGLDDGEGWRVRQWATERLDGGEGTNGQGAGDSDEERADTDKRDRSQSPVMNHKNNPSENRESYNPTSPQRTTSAPPTSYVPAQNPNIVTSAEVFTFQSPISFPQNQDLEMDTSVNIDTINNWARTPLETQTRSAAHTAGPGAPAVALGVVGRPARLTNRHTSSSVTRRSSRTAGTLGNGAGNKRKVPFGEFFDISGLGIGKDNLGGGSSKRSKHT